MHRFWILPLLSVSLISLPVLADKQSPELRAQAAVQAFAASLRSTLMAAMEAGGPIEGIAVCHREAPEIAANLGAAHALSIGRTSHRVRNPDNQPDTWELEVLDAFTARHAAGESIESLVFSAVVSDEQGSRFRMMRGIGTEPACLLCHGSAIDPQVKASIDARYPLDAATGFALGDLRGAFTVSIPLDTLPPIAP